MLLAHQFVLTVPGPITKPYRLTADRPFCDSGHAATTARMIAVGVVDFGVPQALVLPEADYVRAGVAPQKST
jgi:hypothetical protein